MNKDNKLGRFAQNMFHVGTPECAIFFAVAAMVLALLFLALGFWRTMLVAVLVLAGAFLGGVKDKKEWISEKVNRLFPPKASVPYKETNEDIQRAVREARQAREQQETEADEAPAEEEAPAAADDQENDPGAGQP